MKTKISFFCAQNQRPKQSGKRFFGYLQNPVNHTPFIIGAKNVLKETIQGQNNALKLQDLWFSRVQDPHKSNLRTKNLGLADSLKPKRRRLAKTTGGNAQLPVRPEISSLFTEQILSDYRKERGH